MIFAPITQSTDLSKFNMTRYFLITFFLVWLSATSYSQCLNGTYTLGPNGDYPSFPSLATALDTAGVCGHVTIEVLPGQYIGPFKLDTIAGLSPDHTLNFVSQLRDASTATLWTQNGLIHVEGSPYISFKHLSIKDLSGANGAIYALNADAMTVDSCVIVGGVTFVGTQPSHLTFTNNTVLNGGMDVFFVEQGSYQGSATLVNNAINGPVWFEQLNDLQLIDNQIVGQLDIIGSNAPVITDNTIGIFSTIGLRIDTAYAGIFVNNTIKGKSQVANCNGCQFLHNVFHNKSGSVLSTYYSTTPDPLYFYNNIFYSESSGIWVNELPNLVSDYNGFYGNSSFPILYNNIYPIQNGYNTLAEWVAGTSNDQHSVFAEPNFFNEGDYLIAADANLANKGIALSGLATIDIDGELRDATPDIGIDEFSGQVTDAGIVFCDKQQQQACHGHPDVYVRIKNYAADTLHNALLRWSLNGVQLAPVYWEGSLGPGDTSDLVLMGTAPFLHEAQDLVLFTDMATDANHQNDSLFLHDLIVQMGGEYTVCVGDCDFNSLSEAASALSKMGVCAKVDLVVLDSILWDAPQFDSIPGASPLNHVVVRSANGDPHSVQLKVFSTVHESTINIRCSYLKIKGLTLGWNEYNMSSIAWGLKIDGLFGNYPQTSGISIEDCIVNHGFRGSFWNARDISMENNVFRHGEIDFYGPVANARNVSFVNNSFDPLTSIYTIFSRVDSLRFEGNRIMGSHRIVLSICQGKISIQRNRFANDLYKGSLAIFNTSGTAAQPVQVHNNFFGGNLPLVLDNALLLDNAHHVAVYYNTFYSKVNNAFSDACYLRLTNNSSNIKIENNIFHSPEQGRPFTFTDLAAITSCDYNNFTDAQGEIGNPINDPNASLNLQDWQGATGFDAHSTEITPEFTADLPNFPDPTDLHISPDFAGQIRANNPIAAVPTDIDGTPRSLSLPFLGADEPSLIQNDVAVVGVLPDSVGTCVGTQEIVAKIQNQGNVTLSSTTLQWSLNGVQQADHPWTGDLAIGDTASVVLGSLDIGVEDTLHLVVWTSQANGQPDFFPSFDTASIRVTTGLSGEFTIGGIAPDFADLQAAIDSVGIRGLCGDVVLKLRTGAYPLSNFHVPDMRGSNLGHQLTITSEAMNADSVQLLTGTFGYSLINGRQSLLFKHLTFFSPDPLIHHELVLQGISGTFIVDHCRFHCIANGWDISNTAITGSINGDVTIEHCSFYNNAGAVSLQGEGHDLKFNRNVATDLIGDAMLGVSGFRNYDITENNLRGYEGGIYVGAGTGQLEISRNKVAIRNSTGLHIDGWQGQTASVYNNVIAVNAKFDADSIKGIAINQSKAVQLAFNTVSLKTQPIFPFTGTAAEVKNCQDILLQNNILASYITVPALMEEDNTGFIANYNDYFTQLGSYLINQYVALPAWTAATGQDLFSRNYDPVFAADSLIFTNPLLQNTGLTMPGIAADIVGNLRESPPDIGAYESYVQPSLLGVWPGDCNDDGQVDNVDFLSIGLAMGQNLSGAPRSDQGIDWSEKPSAPWGNLLLGKDACYANSNGDGEISAEDSTAILLNYSLVHNFSNTEIDERASVQLYFTDLPDHLVAGQTYSLPLMLADPSGQVSLYGIAFSLAFGSDALDPVVPPVLVFEDSWLGSSEKMAIQQWLPSQRIEAAITRANGQDAVGGGKIATLVFTVNETLTDSLSIQLTAQKAIEFSEVEVPVTGIPSVMGVLPNAVVEPVAGEMKIYPNPSHDVLYFDIDGAAVASVAILDKLGRLALEGSDMTSNTVDISSLPPGHFVLMVETESGARFYGKIIVH